MSQKYCIFSDESGQDGSNRYATLAAISATRDDAKQLNSELKKVLDEFGKNEIKFKEIKNHNSKLIAFRLIDIIIPYLKQGKIWVHILVWDKQDDRHQIRKRDDEANLMRMYYKLLRQVRMNWLRGGEWGFYPDEYSAINWEEDVVKYLQNTPLTKVKTESPQLFYSFYQDQYSKFSNIRELNSEDYPIVQLADFMAGIVRTSRAEKSFYDWYKSKCNGNSILFEESAVSISNSMRPKFEVMKYFKEVASNNKLGINLSKNKHFTTFNHKHNIVIMHYEPQHKLDKAPTKE